MLPLKYSIEKRVISSSNRRPSGTMQNCSIVYTMVSVFTVLIFWCTEYAFHVIFGNEAMRYLGGAIGLAISFIAKYRLDRKFVFVTRDQTGS